MIHEQFVCVHTLNVLYLTTIDEEFLKMNEEQQNIMLWAALLHDIKKLGPPNFNGKDHLHPFKGGAAVLIIFERLGII